MTTRRTRKQASPKVIETGKWSDDLIEELKISWGLHKKNHPTDTDTKFSNLMSKSNPHWKQSPKQIGSAVYRYCKKAAPKRRKESDRESADKKAKKRSDVDMRDQFFEMVSQSRSIQDKARDERAKRNRPFVESESEVSTDEDQEAGVTLVGTPSKMNLESLRLKFHKEMPPYLLYQVMESDDFFYSEWRANSHYRQDVKIQKKQKSYFVVLDLHLLPFPSMDISKLAIARRTAVEGLRCLKQRAEEKSHHIEIPLPKSVDVKKCMNGMYMHEGMKYSYTIMPKKEEEQPMTICMDEVDFFITDDTLVEQDKCVEE